jgi:hypothetical protein
MGGDDYPVILWRLFFNCRAMVLSAYAVDINECDDVKARGA